MNVTNSGNRPDSDRFEPEPCSELLDSIERLTGIGAWAYDGAADELWWSEAAKRVLQIDARSRVDFDGIADCFANLDRSQTKELLTVALETSEPVETDVELAVEGTTEQFVRICATPRREADGVAGLYGTVQDVTDAKRQEQRIEVLRRTSQQLREANSPQAVAEILADTSKNIFGYVNTTVRLVDPAEELLRTVASTEECLERAGERPDYPVDEETPAARTYRTGEPELHTDHNATEDERDRGELLSGLYVPIGDHGVLSAGDIVVDAFDEQDVEAASLLGQLGAKAITRIGWTKRSRAV